MERILEPELMDDAAQARAYAQADFDDVNQAFVDRFLSMSGPKPRRVVDLGCGPGDICIRLARALPETEIVGVDGSKAMLALGRQAAAKAGLEARIEMVQGMIPHELPSGPFDAVVSNSLLHHLHDPSALWTAVKRLAGPEARVLVVDLTRPRSRAEAVEIVEAAAAYEDPILKQDFENSLCAAFTEYEVVDQLMRAGLECLVTALVSSRHLAVMGRMPQF